MDKNQNTSEEHKRLEEYYTKKKDWLKWGPYLSERQWGTVREDYSPNGTAWDYFPHDDARSRAYRWGEDGLAGISEKYSNLCFGLALWNGKDPILKERLFGLSGPEGNHGEDVKELYYYLENTPTHSYMKQLYKYPQNEFPYSQLVDENKRRDKGEKEFEILDTGVFDDNKYFDVVTEYAKVDDEDILIKISITNRNSEAAKIHVLPTLWIRNFWSFRDMPSMPKITNESGAESNYVKVNHPYLAEHFLHFENPQHLLFTENETNDERLFDKPNDHPFKKDLFHKAVIGNDFDLPTSKLEGTKFSPYYTFDIQGNDTVVLKLRLNKEKIDNPFDSLFDETFESRKNECYSLYESISNTVDEEQSQIQRLALSGLLWNKQYYNYEVENWLRGDPKQPQPPESRWHGRNKNWKTLRNHDIHLMPDKWEYPWYAAWDSSFHCVTMAMIDPLFAKEQLLLFTKEWYMAPNGKIPAYEWSFGDVNPPVQAWASLQIYRTEKKNTGFKDIKFLKRMFNKLALNFTWWVNREDRTENNVFEGGFLGLDNIGVFDRNQTILGEAYLEQIDGTAWMALFCLNMLEMSLEIAKEDDAYEDMATKYLGHFVFIAEALNERSIEYSGTWDEEDGFFYDKLVLDDGSFVPIKVQSIVGMLSLVAVLTISEETLEALPKFNSSLHWFRNHRMRNLKYPVIQDFEKGKGLMLSLVPKDRIKILLTSLLDESQFLSDYGIRSLSKVHTHPYSIEIKGIEYSISYTPAESDTGQFGGNSNWRGPIWMPINYLFIYALREIHQYCGDDFQMEYPTGSGNKLSLSIIANELSERLIKIFKTDENGERPIHALNKDIYKDENFKDLILFYEYFHGDNGRGVGASHQTGWTSLVANLIAEKSN
ncbi:Glycosyl hydrolase family 63 C-terminal domain-containing protein [Flavobacteriaceae bacterium MAR_2010_188]|nr:Glycosyl hydrolase family 63 C-terminal domain-containing protein [Flavobacteriaceae bacterium MAR_2010_188]